MCFFTRLIDLTLIVFIFLVISITSPVLPARTGTCAYVLVWLAVRNLDPLTNGTEVEEITWKSLSIRIIRSIVSKVPSG